MTPKPSLRRDSLEKAARKQADTWKEFLSPGKIVTLREEFIWFATRHGAKVRRETLKEAAGIAHQYTAPHCLPAAVMFCGKVEREILALTPRGPEKGRRAK